MDNETEIKNHIKELITDEYIKNHNNIIQSMIKADIEKKVVCKEIICRNCFFLFKCGQFSNKHGVKYHSNFQSIIISALIERLKEYEKRILSNES